MSYVLPGQPGALHQYQAQYDNYIGGQWVPPANGEYFEVVTPITGQTYTRAARGTAADIEKALDAAHAAADAWGRTSPTERSNILLQIADRIDANRELLAYVETIDNGKAIRETLNADIPLSADHFRYFAGAVRTQEGGISQIDNDTVAYHFHEPLGVVGQIIPWNFPILMAAWKLAPALAAGNCVVLKPAEQTPISILVLVSLIGDLLPPGVLNIVNGFGREAGMPLAQSKRIAKIAFTGSTSTGRVIAQAAANSLIPATLELGGKRGNDAINHGVLLVRNAEKIATNGGPAITEGDISTCARGLWPPAQSQASAPLTRPPPCQTSQGGLRCRRYALPAAT